MKLQSNRSEVAMLTWSNLSTEFGKKQAQKARKGGGFSQKGELCEKIMIIENFIVQKRSFKC